MSLCWPRAPSSFSRQLFGNDVTPWAWAPLERLFSFYLYLKDCNDTTARTKRLRRSVYTFAGVTFLCSPRGNSNTCSATRGLHLFCECTACATAGRTALKHVWHHGISLSSNSLSANLVMFFYSKHGTAASFYYFFFLHYINLMRTQ